MISRLLGIFFSVFLLLITLSFLLPIGVFPVDFISPVSGSMEPTVSESDVIIITSTSEASVDDVVLYHSEDHSMPVLHRIVGEDENGFITQGDANSETDQELGFDHLDSEDVIGVAAQYGDDVITIPYLGYIVGNQFFISLLWIIVSIFSLIALSSSIDNNKLDSVDYNNGNPRVAIFFIVLIIIVVFPIVTFATASTIPISITTTEVGHNVDDDSVVGIGEKAEKQIQIESESFIGTEYSIHSSGDIEIIDYHYTNGSVYVNVTTDSLEEVGVQNGEITMYVYATPFNQQTIQSLSEIHYLIPSFISSLAVSLFIILPTIILLDPEKPIRKEYERIRYKRKMKKN